MSKTDVVIEVLLNFLSPATAIGSTEYDDKAYRNLQNICYVHDYCYDLIKDNVELIGNEYSVKRSREYAIKHLKESIENMTDLLKDLEGSEEFKVDQPQETVTEFADRCKECGAHYGRLLNQKWTPVSEELPKKENDKEDRYLTTILNEYDNSLRYVMTCDFISGCWCPDDECASNNVIAWMPLPEPYKAGGSER